METPGGDDPTFVGFLGEYQHTLDTKGRVILPAAHRTRLEEGLVIAAWFDRSLTLLPRARWQEVRAAVRKLAYTDREQRQFARMITSSASEGALDRQGRVTIPPRLREYASLDRDVVVVGADDHLELWDTPRWEAYRVPGLDDFANTNQSFDMGGIF